MFSFIVLGKDKKKLCDIGKSSFGKIENEESYRKQFERFRRFDANNAVGTYYLLSNTKIDPSRKASMNLRRKKTSISKNKLVGLVSKIYLQSN